MTNTKTQTVLVVDDALTIRSYHKTLLEDIGFEVLEAENGMEALEKAVERSISLCLVDVNMPLMDGFTFVSRLRQDDRNSDCPVIMITTESRTIEEDRGYQAGANLYLVKPAEPDHLQAICRLMATPPRGDQDKPSDTTRPDHAEVIEAAKPERPTGDGLFDYVKELISE